MPKVVAPHGGSLKADGAGALAVDFTLLTVGSVPFDAAFIPGGARSTSALTDDGPSPRDRPARRWGSRREQDPLPSTR